MVPVIEAVVFDLGGVLLDFAGETAMMGLAGIETRDELWDRWLTCQWVRQFERGHCSAEVFSAGMVADWGLTLDPATFLQHFTGWLRGPFEGAAELVAEVQRVTRTGCLSNTNQVHWDHTISRHALVSGLDFQFLSFEMGLVKPDSQMFEQVASILDAPPGHVLFLDDNQVNVDGARAVGFQAERVRGVEAARAALVAAGVLTA